MTLPKFSIVIPTVDRHELLDKTIAGCLLSSYPNLEVLVSDNFSAPETAKVVESFRADPRVRYVRTTRRLSMPDHWEFAWQQSKGDYIIINGDDDALSPSLIGRLAEIAGTLNAGLISWDAGLYYHPDWNLSGRNTFSFINSHSRLLFDINPQAVFNDYARLKIPFCFPQGTRICFSRRLADRAVAKTGRVFWPPYPDYSAPLLLLGLLENERYIYWDALMGYGGRSRDSNAAAWDKEGSRTGSPQRARDYFSELQQEDIYPHSTLKIRAYSNGHAETLNLLRYILPEVFARYHVDLGALILAVECEFQGVNIHNPFLGPHERMEFDAFVAKQIPAIVESVKEIVKSRKTEHDIHVMRSNIRLLWPILSLLKHHNSLELIVAKIKQSLIARLTRQRLSSSKPAAGSNLKLAVTYRDGKAWLECDSFGGKDGLDLVRRFDDIVNISDLREVNNLVDFYNQGFLLAAYEANHLTCTVDPIRSKNTAVHDVR
jgi:glycosyltransferase involved in cell wall biosynthesis